MRGCIESMRSVYDHLVCRLALLEGCVEKRLSLVSRCVLIATSVPLRYRACLNGLLACVEDK